MRNGHFFIFLLLMVGAGCPGRFLTNSRQGLTRPAVLAGVERFVDGWGVKGRRYLLKLFDDGGFVEVNGVDVVVQGTDGLRDFFDYGNAIKSKVRMGWVRVVAETVFCVLIEQNELLDIIGAGPAVYDGVFVLKDRRISAISINPDIATRLQLTCHGLSFLNWVRANQPEELKRLMPDGKFKFTGDNGRRLVELLRKWRGWN